MVGEIELGKTSYKCGIMTNLDNDSIKIFRCNCKICYKCFRIKNQQWKMNGGTKTGTVQVPILCKTHAIYKSAKKLILTILLLAFI